MDHRKCEQESCYPLEEGCMLGEPNARSCKYFASKEKVLDLSEEDAANESSINEGPSFTHKLFPWSGKQLGLDDLTFITAQAPVSLIGIMGSENSGKTTFLAALYMLLRGGHCPEGFHFAGSYTMLGWEKISSFLTLDYNNQWSFPPHTSTNQENRSPGLLHLAFKETENSSHIRHLIFTDAPGEWFSEWGINAINDNSQGAEWIDNYADAILIFADRDGLSGESRGHTRGEIIRLIDRVRNHKSSRLTGLVWSKSDKQIGPKIEGKIKYAASKKFENLKEFNVSVLRNGDQDLLENILEIIPWCFSSRSQKIGLSETPHPFFIAQQIGK